MLSVYAICIHRCIFRSFLSLIGTINWGILLNLDINGQKVTRRSFLLYAIETLGQIQSQIGHEGSLHE